MQNVNFFFHLMEHSRSYEWDQVCTHCKLRFLAHWHTLYVQCYLHLVQPNMQCIIYLNFLQSSLFPDRILNLHMTHQGT